MTRVGLRKVLVVLRLCLFCVRDGCELQSSSGKDSRLEFPAALKLKLFLGRERDCLLVGVLLLGWTRLCLPTLLVPEKVFQSFFKAVGL